MSTKILNSHGQILIVFYCSTYMHHFQIYTQIFNIKLIIDMYTCTCTIGRQKESLVFCLTHIQVLNLWVHMNMIKWPLTHVSMLVT